MTTKYIHTCKILDLTVNCFEDFKPFYKLNGAYYFYADPEHRSDNWRTWFMTSSINNGSSFMQTPCVPLTDHDMLLKYWERLDRHALDRTLIHPSQDSEIPILPPTFSPAVFDSPVLESSGCVDPVANHQDCMVSELKRVKSIDKGRVLINAALVRIEIAVHFKCNGHRPIFVEGQHHLLFIASAKTDVKCLTWNVRHLFRRLVRFAWWTYEKESHKFNAYV